MGCHAQFAFRIRALDWSYYHEVAAEDERARFAKLAANTVCWLWTWISAADPGCSDRYSNHFFLDVVGGAIVIALAWAGERMLLNLLPLEDWVLWLLRTHKPEEENGSAVIKLERD